MLIPRLTLLISFALRTKDVQLISESEAAAAATAAAAENSGKTCLRVSLIIRLNYMSLVKTKVHPPNTINSLL